MKNFILAALLIFTVPLTFTGPMLLAAETTGPHGGKVVSNDAYQFEVKIDREGKNVQVYTLDTKKTVPHSMSITLFREPGTGQTIALKAVNLKDPLPKFEGELSPYAGSYMGAELRFDVSLKSFEVLKFIPNIPSTEHR